MGEVHVSKLGGHVRVLTLDNPPMNPMGMAMRATFMAALDEVKTDPDLRAILVTGKGQAFCAGDDLKEDKAGDQGPGGFAHLLKRMDETRIPIVAAVNGWAIGGGFELALACDIRIASTQARFTAAGVNMGLMASAWRLPRLIGISRAKAMLLTGEPVDAATAERFGLVTALHEPSELMDAAAALAMRIASRAPMSVEATKATADQALELSVAQAEALQGPIVERLRASADHREAVAAFREKREPMFTRN